MSSGYMPDLLGAVASADFQSARLLSGAVA
jgi:hypothetical protein